MPFWGPFIVATLSTWAASYVIQHSEWKHQRKLMRLEWEVATASKLLDRVSGGAKESIVRMHDLRDCIRHEGTARALLEEKWQIHRTAQRAWDADLSANLAQVEQYFGLATRWLIEPADTPGSGERTGIAHQITALDAELSRYFREHGANPERFGPAWHEAWDRMELGLRRSVEALDMAMRTAIERIIADPSRRTFALARETSPNDESS